jgi:hypothetical protein
MRLAILALLPATLLAGGCRREPEEIPDAQFSETTHGIIPVSIADPLEKDLLQPAASPVVAGSAEPAVAEAEEPAVEEEEPVNPTEETVEPVATPPGSNPPSREPDSNDPLNGTVGPGFLNRG